MSEESQQYRAAQEDWVRSILRKESGAVIGADEMADEIKTFFPQPGDSAKVIRQKANARKRRVQGLIRESQGAYEGLFGGTAVSVPRQSDEEGKKEDIRGMPDLSVMDDNQLLNMDTEGWSAEALEALNKELERRLGGQ